MNLLKNLSLRTKLFLVSVIPSIGLIVLMYNTIDRSLEQRNAALQVYQECERVERLSELIHQFQNERGSFLAYLSSHSDEDQQKVSLQIPATNAALDAVRQGYQSQGADMEIFSVLDSLDMFRRDLVSYPEKLNTLKTMLLDEIYKISRVSLNPDIKQKLEAHLFLLYNKEYFSRAKNILLPFFIGGELQEFQFSTFIARKGQYDLSRHQFARSAPADVLEFYKKVFQSDVITEVHLKMDSIVNNPSLVNRIGVASWWEQSMAVVAALAETERFSLGRIRERAEAQLQVMDTMMYSNVAIGLLLILAAFVLVYSLIRQIHASIAEIKSVAQKLAVGDVNFTVNIDTKDEIGDLAHSFNTMVRVIREYAEAALRVGKGDYDTFVPVRSDHDVLGKALNDMREDLQRLSKETEVRTWLLTGNNQLSDRLRGEKELPVLADDVIAQLTEYLNAQIGAFYVRENGKLKLTGRYAFSANGDIKGFSLGEGLVGQAASMGRHILLEDVPDDYVRIRSGIGETKPRNLLVYPFKYEGEVRGVLEIGSSGTFSPLDIQLLDLVNDHIGIAVHATQSRETLKQLLEETQRQSEELEAQQEELKQFNEELVEKTHLLEKSEEELKAQQEELQQSNVELVEKAAMLEEQKQNLEFTKLQLETKARELEQASKYKSEFLSNMSHELRTPLNSILILAQVLMENRNKTLSPKEIKFANTIFNSGNDLLNLINEILDLSKIEAGKMELEVAPFSLEVIVQNMTNAFEELARSKKIRFSIECSRKLKQQVITSDHQRIEQIIKNFLSNAFKFTPANGTIQLVIDQAESRDKLGRKSLHHAKDVFSFTVKDTGIGIPEDKLSIIFEAFQQVDGSTKRKYGGTGLGLSISRELTRLLGGEIHVASQLGEGSTFTLYVPGEIEQGSGDKDGGTLTIHAGGPSHESPAPEQATLPDASHYDDQHLITEGDRKILIMEDDVEFAKVLLDFVHERNYKGIIAHQGNIGLSYARHYKPDAIILDMKLPVVDGAEVLRKLKRDPELRHIPVQIISGYDFRKSGLELGAIDFIRKPITKEAFWVALDKVERFVSRKPKRLLIIEDDHQHNKAVQELIGNGDVKCYSAYSGKEAYEMLSKNAFDCIIVDLGLPDMSGFSFLEKLREDKQLSSIPVIVYTGKDLTKDENEQLEKLADTVVLKTAFSHERLLDETTLFLHRVETKLPQEKQNMIRKLHKTDEVLKGKTVLIVDDDDRNVYSLMSALEPEGMKCLKAGNGKAAIEALEKMKDIDMVLMDVMMPEMDGMEATRIIRSIPEFRKIPIIALTAKAMKDDREKCLAAGMSDYISKPVNMQQLLSLMRVWLYA